MSTKVTKTPAVLWSQTSKDLTLIVEAPDVADAKVEFGKNHFRFSGDSKDGISYEVDMQLEKEIDPEHCSYASASQSSRNWTIKLAKSGDSKEFWKSLNAGKKLNNVKVNWALWKEEGESDQELDFGGNSFSMPESFGDEFGSEEDSDDDEAEEEEDKEKKNETLAVDKDADGVKDAEGATA